jgi:hypothetical protein
MAGVAKSFTLLAIGVMLVLCLGACVVGGGNPPTTSQTPGTAQSSLTPDATQQARDQQLALNSYRAAIEDLVAHHGLLTAKPGSDVRVVAHARTVVVFWEISGGEKRALLQRLYTEHLILVPSVIDMTHVDLSQGDYRTMNLSGADLHNANLTGAQLRGTILDRANLKGAEVSQEQLQEAASLKGATLPDGSIHP